MAGQKRRRTPELVTVEDAWGRPHTVPRSMLPPTPGEEDRVFNLAEVGGLEALAVATGKAGDLAAAGTMVLRDGDLRRIDASPSTVKQMAASVALHRELARVKHVKIANDSNRKKREAAPHKQRELYEQFQALCLEGELKLRKHPRDARAYAIETLAKHVTRKHMQRKIREYERTHGAKR